MQPGRARGTTIAIAVTLYSLCPAIALAGYVPRPAVAAAADAAAAQAKTLPDEASLAAALLRTQAELTSRPLPAEAAVHAALLRLRASVRPLAATRTAVSALTEYSSQVMTDPLEVEQARGGPVPAFAIAATARGTLQLWDLAAAEALIARSLRGEAVPVLPPALQARAWARYIERATPTELDALQARGIPDEPAPLLALWQRRATADTALRMFALPITADSYALLADVTARLPADIARPLLMHAAQQPALTSAARIAMAPLVTVDADVRRYLIDTLGDDHGASSAQALAIAADAETVAALSHVLHLTAEGPRLLHALLALRTLPGSEALTLLKAFANDPQRPTPLRAEVQAWLQ